jgi:hypothetical protein
MIFFYSKKGTTRTYPDGAKYEGGFKDGEPNGKGKYTFRD